MELMLKLDDTTRQAITHTRHCLTGCAIGEILGMVIGTPFNNAVQTALAILLAFFFGYLLTYRGARVRGSQPQEAFRLALKVDTVSITSMEIIDNILEWIIPGAINATLGQFLFWWSLAASLAVAFVLTVPVNRWMIARGAHEHAHNH